MYWWGNNARTHGVLASPRMDWMLFKRTLLGFFYDEIVEEEVDLIAERRGPVWSPFFRYQQGWREVYTDLDDDEEDVEEDVDELRLRAVAIGHYSTYGPGADVTGRVVNGGVEKVEHTAADYPDDGDEENQENVWIYW